MSNQNKTVPTGQNVDEVINGYPAQQAKDARKLVKIMSKITGSQPRMWGKMVGFGEYHYKYASGREGDAFIVGFAPRSKEMTIYVFCSEMDYSQELVKLGKHKRGKACLYIKSLQDIDVDALTRIIEVSVKYMKDNYETKL
jgi:Domain of unknown function (DU1801)